MNELEKWKQDVYKYFRNKYFMSNPDNWDELAQKAAEEYIQKNAPKQSNTPQEIYGTGTLPELVVTPTGNATTTYSSEVSETDPEYQKYKQDQLQKSYELGSQVSSAMNEAGNGIKEWGEFGLRVLPIVGTVYDIGDAIKDPTALNIGLASASVLGDALSIFGVGEGINTAIAATKAGKKVATATRAFEQAQKGAQKAREIYEKAYKYYKKLEDNLTSITLLSGNNMQITNAARKLNQAREQLHSAEENLIKSYRAYDGSGFPVVTKKLNLPNSQGSVNLEDVYQRTKNFHGNGGAEEALNSASNVYKNSRKRLPSTTEKVVIPLVSPIMHANINKYKVDPQIFDEEKQQKVTSNKYGGKLNYLKHYK